MRVVGATGQFCLQRCKLPNSAGYPAARNVSALVPPHRQAPAGALRWRVDTCRLVHLSVAANKLLAAAENRASADTGSCWGGGGVGGGGGHGGGRGRGGSGGDGGDGGGSEDPGPSPGHHGSNAGAIRLLLYMVGAALPAATLQSEAAEVNLLGLLRRGVTARSCGDSGATAISPSTTSTSSSSVKGSFPAGGSGTGPEREGSFLTALLAEGGEEKDAAAPLPPPTVSVVVPALNEAKGIRDTLQYLEALAPAAAEVIVVDGGSSDGTVRVARKAGARVVTAGRGRARQMNRGAEVAKGDILVFVHADSRPPRALVSAVRAALAPPRTVVGGFNTVMEHGGRVLWFHTFHHLVKTYYAPLLFRPLSYARGLRCLFGDQTLFCRAADFRRVGGYNGDLPLMEDLDLVIRLHMAGPGGGLRGRGRVAHVLRPLNVTSGRRLGAWGNVRGTYIMARIAAEWYFGASPHRMRELYRTMWTDQYR